MIKYIAKRKFIKLNINKNTDLIKQIDNKFIT